MKPGAIVTDIEGTTSSLSFVHDILFPYSRARLADYVAARRLAVEPILDEVREEAGSDLDADACVALLLDWHDADRKIGPLKQLQGLIWAEAYASGAFTGHVYPDAVAGLRRWHAAGIPLYVYSSGSVAAQKLLFGHSDAGDLTPLFTGHFDTAVGAKREAAAYRAITTALSLPPETILFLSDIEAELDAAREAGLSVTLLARDGAPASTGHPTAASFDTILPQEALA